MTVPLTEGWGKPGLSKKWHYFRGTMALCRRWGFYRGELEQGNDDSNENCTACKKLYKKELGNPPVIKQ